MVHVWMLLVAFFSLCSSGWAAPVMVWLEAEQGALTAPLVTGTDATASGGEYVWVPNGQGNLWDANGAGGEVVYHFSVPAAGTYALWGRVIANNGNDDSFFVKLDTGTYSLWSLWGITPHSGQDPWGWGKIMPTGYTLTPGEHTLRIKQREDGTKLDRLLITNDLHFVPTDSGRPNIIVFLIDDMGISLTSPVTYGGIYETPNIDALARQGTIFTHAFAQPQCTVSRGALMTGLYQHHTGITGETTVVSPEKFPMLPKLLQQQGYVTAVAGKFGLDYLYSMSQSQQWGWNEYYRWRADTTIGWDLGAGAYWYPSYLHNSKRIQGGANQYGPDLTHAFVVDFITRNRTHPFFLFYGTVGVHSPVLDTPDQATGDLFAANVRYVDKLLGQLVAHLQQQGLLNKTVILLLGDNGYQRWADGPEEWSGPKEWSGLVDGRLIQGSKMTLLEGGARVPLIVSWPGITPARATVDDLIDLTDFLPTLLELAGGQAPTTDGISFAPRLREQSNGKKRAFVYGQWNGAYYIRSRDFKLYNNGTLYDMSDAPWRERFVPVAGESTTARAARQQLQEYLQQIGRFDPIGRPDYTPAQDAGYFLWQDADDGEWHLRWSGDSPTSLHYVGVASANRPLSNVRSVRFESNDLLEVEALALNFNAFASRGEDGIDFFVPAGTTVTFNLTVNTVAAPQQIHIGRLGPSPIAVPFLVVTTPLASSRVSGEVK